MTTATPTPYQRAREAYYAAREARWTAERAYQDSPSEDTAMALAVAWRDEALAARELFK